MDGKIRLYNDNHCNDNKLKGGGKMTKCDTDNHANQCNPNNDAYWESRDYDERPEDWEEQIDEKEDK